MWGRRFFAAVLGVLGFAVVWRVALGYAYEQQGFDPGRDILAADCDDCGITEFLDALPVLVPAVLAYVAVLIVALLWLRSRHIL